MLELGLTLDKNLNDSINNCNFATVILEIVFHESNLGFLHSQFLYSLDCMHSRGRLKGSSQNDYTST